MVAVAVSPTHLVAANAGDSRAVLALSCPGEGGGAAEAGDSPPNDGCGRNGSAAVAVLAHELTSDHKPGRADEQQVRGSERGR